MDRLRRWAYARKFEATLPSKIDAAIDQVKLEDPKIADGIVSERGVFGQQGWSISKSNPAMNHD